ncbi:alpha-N-acetylgalactosaminide alpha-2,6-sialyltransferase 1-like [Colossoma macropomum]|uniref:alpha-N-acetylgalactosaminide alpha-2,6-sialyltransferase 1-like n=1 Tax=Colossoma macropomum TaxID=42526 RepID=UPI0018653FA0|nr:alpha-N-acetylgalactosaminide alpha-2,6-sialyltransferase 1-like [Colossoma macropomum]
MPGIGFAIIDNNTNAPQVMSNMTWRLTTDMEKAKEDSEALKMLVMDGSAAKVQHNLANADQRDSRVGIQASPERANKDTKNKTAGSLIPSQLELVKKVEDAPKDSQPSVPNKNEPKPMKTKENSTNTVQSNLEHQGQTISQSMKPGAYSKLTPIPVMFKKDFKRMPYWEINDVYLRSDEPVQTVCAESLRKTKDPDFQKAYMPNIQMYLYQNLLNLSEWNRLAHFNNPFGFMEYNYSEIKSAVDLIPKPNVTQLLPLVENDSCIRCAVVANGGILHGSKKGKEIDAHTYVFRMNGAVTQGHEEDVGNKTSVYVHTAYSLVASLAVFRKYGFKKIPNDKGYKYVMIPEGLRDFHWLQGLLNKEKVPKGEFQSRMPRMFYPKEFDESRFYVLHPDFLRYVRNRFMPSRQQNGTHWALYRPTNGAFTLFLALHVCDTVDAYGFITETHKNYSNYYFEKEKTRVIFFINHDYNLEIKLWKKLHDDKIIRLYQGEGGKR